MTNTSSANALALPKITLPLPASRQAIENAIEKLIGLLDGLDPDPDLEPSTGCAGGYGTPTWADEAEPDADGEPWLGSLERTDQRGWAASGDDDREEECEDEGADIDTGGNGATSNHVWVGMRRTIVAGRLIGVSASAKIGDRRDPQPHWGHVAIIGGRTE